MNVRKDMLDPERLFEATEAVILALTEVAEPSGRCPRPVDLLGSADQPECLVDFTRFEVEEATEFLARLGYLEVRRSSNES